MEKLQTIPSRISVPEKALQIAFILLFIFTSFHSHAQHAASLFQSANTYYQNKQYDEAALLYHQVLKKDRNNVNAHFNLGNTYFHLKRYPEAVLHYEKARKLEPDNKYVLHNIQLTNNKLFSEIELGKEFFVTKSVKNFVQSKSSSSWSIALLLMLWTGVLALCIHFFFGNSTLFKVGASACLLSLLLAVFTWQAYRAEHKNQFAIILGEQAFLKKTPVKNEKSKDSIQAGSKVELLDNDKNWYKIKLSNGKTGWLENHLLEKI